MEDIGEEDEKQMKEKERQKMRKKNSTLDKLNWIERRVNE